MDISNIKAKLLLKKIKPPSKSAYNHNLKIFNIILLNILIIFIKNKINLHVVKIDLNITYKFIEYINENQAYEKIRIEFFTLNNRTVSICIQFIHYIDFDLRLNQIKILKKFSTSYDVYSFNDYENALKKILKLIDI